MLLLGLTLLVLVSLLDTFAAAAAVIVIAAVIVVFIAARCCYCGYRPTVVLTPLTPVTC